MNQRFQSFVTGITICYKYIQRIKSMEMTELGWKGTHVMCLFFLHRNPEGITAARLSQLCAEDKAAISRSVAFLQQEGYLVAVGSRYRANLVLTEKGRETAQQVEKLIEKWVGFGGEGLSEEDRAAFYRVLEHISGNLRDTMDQKQGKE